MKGDMFASAPSFGPTLGGEVTVHLARVEDSMQFQLWIDDDYRLGERDRDVVLRLQLDGMPQPVLMLFERRLRAFRRTLFVAAAVLTAEDVQRLGLRAWPPSYARNGLTETEPPPSAAV